MPTGEGATTKGCRGLIEPPPLTALVEEKLEETGAQIRNSTVQERGRAGFRSSTGAVDDSDAGRIKDETVSYRKSLGQDLSKRKGFDNPYEVNQGNVP